MNSENKKISYVASMILYNVLLGINEDLKPEDFIEIIKNILPFQEETPEFM